MTDQRPRYWWAISAIGILAVGLAAGMAYNIGLSQGLAQVPVPAGSVLPHGWHRPGGFGFLFPLMFVAFWILMWRGLFWRPWRPWHDGYGRSPRDRFDDWHRAAHERMERPHDVDRAP